MKKYIYVVEVLPVCGDEYYGLQADAIEAYAFMSSSEAYSCYRDLLSEYGLDNEEDVESFDDCVCNCCIGVRVREIPVSRLSQKNHC